FEDCEQALKHASIFDISDLTKPRMISLLPLTVPPATWKTKSFCEQGGPFGPHNQNQLQHNPFVRKTRNLLHLPISMQVCASMTSAYPPCRAKSATSCRPTRKSGTAPFRLAASRSTRN